MICSKSFILALQACVTQIEQMKSAYIDEDGAIGAALREARSLLAINSANDTMMFDIDALGSVLSMAGAHIDDITSGLDEGLYEASENRDLGYKIASRDSVQSFYDDWLAAQVPCIRVEYDTLFTGGNYTDIGEFVLIPLSLISAAEKETSEDDAVELAFRKLTHLDSMHIVHYTMDELYNQFGEPFETLPGVPEDTKDHAVDVPPT